MFNYTLRPWEICCLVSVLLYLLTCLSVVFWINREKKLYDQSINQPGKQYGTRFSTDNGNSIEKEKELFELWLQIPPDQQKKHANGM